MDPVPSRDEPTKPITVAATAAQLSVSPQRIRKLLADDELTGIKDQNGWLIDPASITAYTQRGRRPRHRPALPAELSEPVRPRSTRLPAIAPPGTEPPPPTPPEAVGGPANAALLRANAALVAQIRAIQAAYGQLLDDYEQLLHTHQAAMLDTARRTQPR